MAAEKKEQIEFLPKHALERNVFSTPSKAFGNMSRSISVILVAYRQEPSICFREWASPLIIDNLQQSKESFRMVS
jgi:hypothetical protein